MKRKCQQEKRGKTHVRNIFKVNLKRFHLFIQSFIHVINHDCNLIFRNYAAAKDIKMLQENPCFQGAYSY